MENYFDFFRRFNDFEGRTSRRVFWTTFLINMIVSPLIAIIPVINIIFLLFSLVAGLAIWTRRLHDIGEDGTSIILLLLPPLSLYPIYLALLRGQEGSNEYGPNPEEEIVNSVHKKDDDVSTREFLNKHFRD